MQRAMDHLSMTSLLAVTCTWACAAALHTARVQAEQPARDGSSTAGQIAKRLSEMVPEIRAEQKLVGLGAMIMVDGQVVASAVDGERKKGSGTALEIGDRWHLGSITKSMTATMVARLIERQQLEWTTTVGQCLGELMDVHADYQNVTVEQLLTHTSGAPANFPLITQFQHPPEGKERMDARKKAVAAILKQEPTRPPGESFGYSNVGFTIAAVMVEQKVGRSWEHLIRREIFDPLEISQAGFGPPKDPEADL